MQPKLHSHERAKLLDALCKSTAVRCAHQTVLNDEMTLRSFGSSAVNVLVGDLTNSANTLPPLSVTDAR